MKKTLIIIGLVLAAAITAHAAAIPDYGTADSFTTRFTSISNTTATTLGTSAQFQRPYSDITCIVTQPSGTAPNSTSFTLKGGIDSTNLVTLGTFSTSTYPSLFTTRTGTAPPVLFYRTDLTSGNMLGGTIRTECQASH